MTKELKQKIYIHRITKQEFTATREEDGLYKAVSIDKGNIRYISFADLENKFKEKK